ncbi:stealth family protein [Pantoea sp. LMR881]|uniref:stealth family protein n=1 Tax=Pantoea sp. LMR881 TaxID=3014336 RepID=UPI0022B05BF4|nr:stealth family protein [Pantoea sp. LMR881]MCZ4060268.1 stealth family protein [Pantoea sp. LMR881]
MTLSIYSKKINKLLRNPNLFFYDYFKKKTFVNTSNQTKKIIDDVVTTSNISIDIVEIKKSGLNNYIQKNLNCGIAPEDGFDKNSLLVWSGYLNGLIHFINNLKISMSMDLTIYTLGGGYNIQVSSQQSLDVKTVSNKLSTRPDFVIELSNQASELYILHIYLYDISNDGIAIVRSNRAIVRKCLVEEVENIFSLHDSSYNENIDAVYTWVNQSDPSWQKLWLETFPDQIFDPDRFTSNDELKYSLRSLNKYAPWLNKIYIVSNCSKPAWLNDSKKIIWVSHEDIFPDKDMLPTFNSHAIECNLHNIKGLSEKFIYLNDDFILSQPCLPSDFYDETGRSISYFEPYGMVSPETKQAVLPDYLIAAKNSNLLLKESFPKYNARNLHRHVPYALKKISFRANGT